jgi:hypothetical protein
MAPPNGSAKTRKGAGQTKMTSKPVPPAIPLQLTQRRDKSGLTQSAPTPRPQTNGSTTAAAAAAQKEDVEAKAATTETPTATQSPPNTADMSTTDVNGDAKLGTQMSFWIDTGPSSSSHPLVHSEPLIMASSLAKHDNKAQAVTTTNGTTSDATQNEPQGMSTAPYFARQRISFSHQLPAPPSAVLSPQSSQAKEGSYCHYPPMFASSFGTVAHIRQIPSAPSLLLLDHLRQPPPRPNTKCLLPSSPAAGCHIISRWLDTLAHRSSTDHLICIIHDLAMEAFNLAVFTTPTTLRPLRLSPVVSRHHHHQAWLWMDGHTIPPMARETGSLR